MFCYPCATNQPRFTENEALKHKLCTYLYPYMKSLCKMTAFCTSILLSAYYLKCIRRATKGFCSIKNNSLHMNRNAGRSLEIKHRGSSSTSVKPQVGVASNPKFTHL